MATRKNASDEFSARLAAAMEILNYSRVALARELSLDKAVVSRWLAGENRPTEHNLTRLTDLVRRARPGFTLADWRGSQERFAEALGAVPSPAAEEQAARLIIRGLQTPSVPRRWQRYFGLWLGFYSSLLNDGAILLWGMRVYADELGMRFQTSFGPLGGEGPAVIAGGRLHLLTEVSPLHDRIAYFVFNAVHTPRADLLDGLIAVPAADVDGTPTASLLRAVRVGDGGGNKGGDGPVRNAADIDALGDKIRQHNRDILRAIRSGRSPVEAVAPLAPASLVSRVIPRVGAAHPDGGIDHVLRVRVGGLPPRSAVESAQTALRRAFGLNGRVAMPAAFAASRIAGPA